MLLDEDRDVRVLEIFGGEELLDLLLGLGRGQVADIDRADQRQADLAA